MSDNLTIQLEISDGQAEVVIGRNKQKLQDFVRDAEKLQPNIKFNVPNQNYIELDKLEKRAAETRKALQNITAGRLDSGQVNNLTRDLVKAHERSQILNQDIANIKKELANPNRKSSIAFLTEELKAAEREVNQLERKLSSLSGSGVRSSLASATNKGGGLNLSSFQKQNLFYQANDVATMAALGANPTQILASQGGQIAQIFDAQQATALVATYGRLIPILGAGAAAIALTYKITGDIRAEAERRLKVEETIASTVNKQVLAGQEILKNFEQTEKFAQNRRVFNRSLEGSSVESLIEQRRRLLEINSLTSPTETIIENGKTAVKENPLFKQRLEEISILNQKIDELNNKQSTYNKGTIFQDIIRIEEQAEKSRQEAEKRRLEQAETFKKSVEQGIDKAKELSKQYNSVFDNLFAKTAGENPFSSFLVRADKELRDLRENLKGATPEMKALAESLYGKNYSNELFGLKIDNKLSSFNLRDEAANFRNPFDPIKFKQEEEKFIQRFLSNNPNYLYLKGKTSVDDESRRDILRFGNFDTPEKRLNEKLDKQFNLLFGSNLTASQQGIADKRFLSLTQGVNPLDLDSRNRERAALVREREAVRVEQYQQEAISLQRETVAVNRQIADNQKRLIQIAEKQGANGINLTVKDESGKVANVSQRPTPADTQNHYQLGNYGINKVLTNKF